MLAQMVTKFIFLQVNSLFLQAHLYLIWLFSCNFVRFVTGLSDSWALHSFVESYIFAGGVSTLLNWGIFFLRGEILILNSGIIIFVVSDSKFKSYTCLNWILYILSTSTRASNFNECECSNLASCFSCVLALCIRSRNCGKFRMKQPY